MSPSGEVPDKVLAHLLLGFAEAEADLQIREGAKRGELDHVGDPLGVVVTWLWRTRPNQAMLFLNDYLYELRERNPAAPNPKIRLDDVLDGLILAVPGLTNEDRVELCARARAEVPGIYGADLNA